MKPSDTSTHSDAMAARAYAQRFRNQATGIGQCLSASQSTGANRSRRVIDAAPPAQLAVADYSYPSPGPAFDPLTGKPIDRVTGKAYKAPADEAMPMVYGMGVLR